MLQLDHFNIEVHSLKLRPLLYLITFNYFLKVVRNKRGSSRHVYNKALTVSLQRCPYFSGEFHFMHTGCVLILGRWG